MIKGKKTMNSKLPILLGIVIAVIIIAGGTIWYRAGNTETIPETSTTTPSTAQSSETTSSSHSSSSTSTPGSDQGSGILLTEVAKHNTSSDCWTVINGEVYDMTSFIQLHPGGASQIARICGIDGTSLFGAQHGGEGAPQAELVRLKIGKVQ